MHSRQKPGRCPQGSRYSVVQYEDAHGSSKSIHHELMTLGHMLFLCIALVVFIGIIYTVKPMHCPFSPFQLVQGHDTVPDTLLATGRIRCGCSLPRMSPSILANATAALSIDCSYSITSGKHHSSSWTVQQKQLSSFSSAVPEQLAVTGLDAVTCAVIQATADCAGSSISVDVTLQAQQQQQQYVFLLQRIDSGHHDDTLKGPRYHLVEYAPLPAINTDATLSFLLAEWSTTTTIMPLGCHTSTSNFNFYPLDNSHSNPLLQAMAQQRLLLQSTKASPSPSPAPTSVQDPEASPDPQPSPAPWNTSSSPTPSPTSQGKEQDTGAGKPPVSDDTSGNNTARGQADAEVGNAPDVHASDGPHQSSHEVSPSPSPLDDVPEGTNVTAGSTRPGFDSKQGSNSTVASIAANTSSTTDAQPTVRAASPTDVQQQQALTALLADSSRLNGTVNADPVDNKTVCMQPPTTGPCRAAIPRWSYDAEQGECIEFTWGGCNGNDNRFETLQDCMEACAGVGNATLPGLMPIIIPVNAETSPEPSLPVAPAGAGFISAAPIAVAPAVSPPREYHVATTTLPDQVIGGTAGASPAPSASGAVHTLSNGGVQLVVTVTMMLCCNMWL